MFKNWQGKAPTKWAEMRKYIPGGDPAKQSADLRRYIDGLFDQYMFCDDQDERKRCVCSSCHKTVRFPNRTSHGDTVTCPHCGQQLQVKHLWRGSKKLLQGFIVVWFDKATDGKSIIGRMIVAGRNPASCPNAKQAGETKSFVAFVALYIYGYGCIEAERSWGKYYTHTPKRGITEHVNLACWCKRHASKASLATASAGTPFEWSQWDRMGWEWKQGCGAWRYLDFFAKYEAAEYMAKMNLKKVIHSYIGGYSWMGTTINWHGHTPNEIFKMRTTKQDRLYLHDRGKEISSGDLYMWAQVNKYVRMPLGESKELFHGETMPKHILRYVDPRRAMRYISKQSRDGVSVGYRAGYIHDYDDYIGQAVILGMDMKDKSVLFPRNLQQAHQNLTKQIEMKGNELIEAAWIKRRAALVRKYHYEQDGLRIVIPEHITDLVIEGKQQNNCVGTYMKRVAAGGTDVVFIREIESDGSTSLNSYITMEVCHGEIVQARTKCNGRLDARGESFVEKFIESRLKKARKSA